MMVPTSAMTGTTDASAAHPCVAKHDNAITRIAAAPIPLEPGPFGFLNSTVCECNPGKTRAAAVIVATITSVQVCAPVSPCTSAGSAITSPGSNPASACPPSHDGMLPQKGLLEFRIRVAEIANAVTYATTVTTVKCMYLSLWALA